MGILSRSAIVMRPRKAFLKWMRLDDEEGLADEVFADLTKEPTVYLVPDWDEPAERRLILQQIWPVLFEEMLTGWITDPARWPEARTEAMFKEWFELESFMMIDDLCEEEELSEEVELE